MVPIWQTWEEHDCLQRTHMTALTLKINCSEVSWRPHELSGPQFQITRMPVIPLFVIRTQTLLLKMTSNHGNGWMHLLHSNRQARQYRCKFDTFWVYGILPIICKWHISCREFSRLSDKNVHLMFRRVVQWRKSAAGIAMEYALQEIRNSNGDVHTIHKTNSRYRYPMIRAVQLKTQMHRSLHVNLFCTIYFHMCVTYTHSRVDVACGRYHGTPHCTPYTHTQIEQQTQTNFDGRQNSEIDIWQQKARVNMFSFQREITRSKRLVNKINFLSSSTTKMHHTGKEQRHVDHSPSFNTRKAIEQPARRPQQINRSDIACVLNWSSAIHKYQMNI